MTERSGRSWWGIALGLCMAAGCAEVKSLSAKKEPPPETNIAPFQGIDIGEREEHARRGVRAMAGMRATRMLGVYSAFGTTPLSGSHAAGTIGYPLTIPYHPIPLAVFEGTAVAGPEDTIPPPTEKKIP